MTTIAEEKGRREIELKNAPDMVVMMRIKVIEAVELALEMKKMSDKGLSNAYHEIALFYGEQRSILRGLSASDVMHFNLPDNSAWNTLWKKSKELTFPTKTQFGYEFVDNKGRPAKIDDPELYYLTGKKGEKKDTYTLSTMEEDADAFTSPIPLFGQQQTILTWGAAVFNMRLSQAPQPGSLIIQHDGTQAAKDDGAGTITGTGISGTIDYQNRKIHFTSTDPISPSELVYAVYDTNTNPVVRAIHDQIMVKTDSSGYICEVGNKVVPGTLKVHIDDVEAAVADDAGNITGSSVSGTIDYTSKNLSLIFSNPDDRFKTISLIYDSITNESLFEESYSPIDFTSVAKPYLTGHTLNLINISDVVLKERPKLASSTLLRRKKDHQVAGTLKIICEGLERNPGWDHLKDKVENTTKISPSEFKSLLGFLDMENPEKQNDLLISAKAHISSSGRKVGENSYPDIEKNPFWPCTDGTYMGSTIYKGHYVYPKQGDAKEWATHNHIKWRYGTRPNGYNQATYATAGSKEQDDPKMVIKALEAVKGFAWAGLSAVPEDKKTITVYEKESGGNILKNKFTFSGITKSEGMVGEYVCAYTMTKNGTTNTYVKVEPGTIISCYYNHVQLLIDDYLNDLLVLPEDTNQPRQLQKIIELGNVANLLSENFKDADNSFFNNTVSFKATLNEALTYHKGFDPLDRKGYDTSKMNILKKAAKSYLSQVNARLAKLDEILGDPETAGSYSQIIYDSCNYAAQKGVGYLRDVIDKLYSIQDTYDMITQKRQEYEVYQGIDISSEAEIKAEDKESLSQ